MAQVLTSESALIKSESIPRTNGQPAELSVNALNEVSCEVANEVTDNTLTTFLKALAALDPVAKATLIQSILLELSAASTENASPPAGDIVSQSNISSPVKTEEEYHPVIRQSNFHPASSSLLSRLSPPSVNTNSSPQVLPRLVPSSVPISQPTVFTPIQPNSFVTLLQNKFQTPLLHNQTATFLRSPTPTLPTTGIPTLNIASTSRVPLNFASSSSVQTVLGHTTPNLPVLVPVSTDIYSISPLTTSSLITAPTSSSVMSSGTPTCSSSMYSYSTAMIGVNNHVSSVNNHVSSINNYDQISRNDDFVLDALRNRPTSEPVSQQIAAPNDVSLDSDDLKEQAGKLAEQLMAVRSRLLIGSIDGTRPKAQYLEQLVKLEQLIRILQDAIAQRKAAQTQPSVILGGRRLSEDSVSVFVQSLKLNPNEAVSGVKRKSGSKPSQKPGKKHKHSGGSHGIQLWQFILELLGDEQQRPVISWTGHGLEFRIINSVELARLWGIRKRNPIMNFDKLSRALRYYYEKNIIKHNPMHRLVYSFCNNPDDIVYNALLSRALATSPTDPQLAKQQVGKEPYHWHETSKNVPKSIKVTLQAIRNRISEDDNKNPFALPVDNS